jgi:hypothetical protein
MFFVHSCSLLLDLLSEPKPTNGEIKVLNQTNENVTIYYYSELLGKKSTLTTIYCDETKLTSVSFGVEYYAKGESSNKEYGSQILSFIPPNYDIQQTWVIRDSTP